MPTPASRAHSGALARPPLSSPDARTHSRELTVQLRRLQADHHALQRGVRDELITLVNAHVILRPLANDALARLGLPPLPCQYVAAARVPVTVTVSAPHAGYAERAAAAQIVAELRGLHHAYLRGPSPSGSPAEYPVRDAVTVVHAVRVPRSVHGGCVPGQRRYLVSATVRLAVSTWAPDSRTAWNGALYTLHADLHRLRLRYVSVHTNQLTRSWVRRADRLRLTTGRD
jgi:hypothetical protein